MANNSELIFYIGMISGCIMIAHRWAKHGLLELYLRGPNERTAKTGFLIVTATLFSGYIFHRFIPDFDPLGDLNQEMRFLAVLPLLWFFLMRHLIMPRGMLEFNKARTRLEYLTARHYRPGIILYEQAIALKNHSLTEKTIELFKLSIAKQRYGKKTRMLERTIILKKDRRDNLGNYLFICPVCAKELRCPDYEKEILAEVCNLCGSMIHAHKDGLKLYANIILKQGMKIVSDNSRYNIAIAYVELAFLYRQMNETGEAEVFLHRSLAGLERLMENEPYNRVYLITQSLIFFRWAELKHISGDLEAAYKLYNKSLEIDTFLGEEGGIYESKEMLSRLSRGTEAAETVDSQVLVLGKEG